MAAAAESRRQDHQQRRRQQQQGHHGRRRINVRNQQQQRHNKYLYLVVVLIVCKLCVDVFWNGPAMFEQMSKTMEKEREIADHGPPKPIQPTIHQMQVMGENLDMGKVTDTQNDMTVSEFFTSNAPSGSSSAAAAAAVRMNNDDATSISTPSQTKSTLEDTPPTQTTTVIDQIYYINSYVHQKRRDFMEGWLSRLYLQEQQQEEQQQEEQTVTYRQHPSSSSNIVTTQYHRLEKLAGNTDKCITRSTSRSSGGVGATGTGAATSTPVSVSSLKSLLKFNICMHVRHVAATYKRFLALPWIFPYKETGNGNGNTVLVLHDDTMMISNMTRLVQILQELDDELVQTNKESTTAQVSVPVPPKTTNTTRTRTRTAIARTVDNHSTDAGNDAAHATSNSTGTDSNEQGKPWRVLYLDCTWDNAPTSLLNSILKKYKRNNQTLQRNNDGKTWWYYSTREVMKQLASPPTKESKNNAPDDNNDGNATSMTMADQNANRRPRTAARGMGKYCPRPAAIVWQSKYLEHLHDKIASRYGFEDRLDMECYVAHSKWMRTYCLVQENDDDGGDDVKTQDLRGGGPAPSGFVWYNFSLAAEEPLLSQPLRRSDGRNKNKTDSCHLFDAYTPVSTWILNERGLTRSEIKEQGDRALSVPVVTTTTTTTTIPNVHDERQRQEQKYYLSERKKKLQLSRIYYHNLEKNVARRRHMEHWLSRQSVPYQRINATFPHRNDTNSKNNDVIECVAKKNTPQRCRGMTGIVRTLTSILDMEEEKGKQQERHKEHDNNDHIDVENVTLILEDDVAPVALDWNRLLESIQYVPDDWDLIRFDCWGVDFFLQPYEYHNDDAGTRQVNVNDTDHSPMLTTNDDNHSTGKGDDGNNDSENNDNNSNKRRENWINPFIIDTRLPTYKDPFPCLGSDVHQKAAATVAVATAGDAGTGTGTGTDTVTSTRKKRSLADCELCGGAYAMLWRQGQRQRQGKTHNQQYQQEGAGANDGVDSSSSTTDGGSFEKLRRMWNQVPTEDADCVIAKTDFVKSYCINIGFWEHLAFPNENSDVSKLRS